MAGEIKTVVVFKRDRLSRSLSDVDGLVRNGSPDSLDDAAFGLRRRYRQTDCIRSVRRGEARRERQAAGIAAAKAKGRTDAEIAAIVGVDRSTVFRRLRPVS